MKSEPQSEIAARYLLGELCAEERTRFEERYFHDDSCFELLCAAEEELIDRYVHGELSGSERARFERTYCNTPRRRQRVQIAKAATHFHQRRRRSLWFHAAIASAAAAVVSVLAVGWLWQDNSQLRDRLSTLAEQTQRRQDGPSPAVATFALGSGLARSGGATASMPRVVIRRGEALLRLEMTTPAQPRVDRGGIETVDGTEIWSQAILRISPEKSGGASLALILPAQFLGDGDYVLRLHTRSARGGYEVAYSQAFTVVRE